MLYRNFGRTGLKVSPICLGCMMFGVKTEPDESYQIIDRANIRVLRDPFTHKPYVKLYSTKRVGGDVINFDAIKLLQIAS